MLSLKTDLYIRIFLALLCHVLQKSSVCNLNANIHHYFFLIIYPTNIPFFWWAMLCICTIWAPVKAKIVCVLVDMFCILEWHWIYLCNVWIKNVAFNNKKFYLWILDQILCNHISKCKHQVGFNCFLSLIVLSCLLKWTQ